MYNKLKRMYLEGRLDEGMLSNAVKKGWITESQKEEIIQAKANLLDETNIIKSLV